MYKSQPGNAGFFLVTVDHSSPTRESMKSRANSLVNVMIDVLSDHVVKGISHCGKI